MIMLSKKYHFDISWIVLTMILIIMELEYNAEKLQEILNRIMQTIMSIITSALHLVHNCSESCCIT